MVRTKKIPLAIRQNKIIERVCHYYGVSYSALVGRRKHGRLVLPRHLCMYLLRRELKMTLPEIGDLFGRHHTTVMHAIECINNYIETGNEEIINQLKLFYPHWFSTMD